MFSQKLPTTALKEEDPLDQFPVIAGFFNFCWLHKPRWFAIFPFVSLANVTCLDVFANSRPPGHL